MYNIFRTNQCFSLREPLLPLVSLVTGCLLLLLLVLVVICLVCKGRRGTTPPEAVVQTQMTVKASNVNKKLKGEEEQSNNYEDPEGGEGGDEDVHANVTEQFDDVDIYGDEDIYQNV